MKVVDLQGDYKVVDHQHVSLSIRLGDAQIGASIVFSDDAEIGRGAIENLSMSSGAALRGKKLKIKSIVTDVNDLTNQTSITYLLNGGVVDQAFTSNATVDANGGSVVYRAIFSLV